MNPKFSSSLTVAVAGNPNSGKTTIFNNMTGARQHVGNYPGVTVEWKEGRLKRGDLDLKIVDLPGTYSLTAFSEEELVARDYLLHHAPDVVIDVVDASNLERHLFLTTELLELGLPVVLVLNMMDVARNQGLRLDLDRLSKTLNVPVVPAVGFRNEGTEEIIAAVAKAAGSQPSSLSADRVTYAPAVEAAISRVSEYVPAGRYRRWLATKLLDNDEQALKELPTPEARRAVQQQAAAFSEAHDGQPDTVLAQGRYDFIQRVCDDVVERLTQVRETGSDRVDRWIMHPIWGVPIFLGMMYLVFTATFTLGTPGMNLIEAGFGWLAETIGGFWGDGGGDSPLRSLLVDGIIGGVGGVLVFLPNIVLLFLAIAVLEGTGYMARAAFVMDRFMSKVGLHGKSFIPLLIGFGCTVPAIMATRTLETRRDRIITMMVLPLMSCGARFPIYSLLIPAFFAPGWRGPMMWIIYVTGIVLAMLSALLLRATVFKGETTAFLMELPPYRVPTARSLLVQMWNRAWLYVKKAGTVILGVSILLWVLTFYPKPPADYVPPQGFDTVDGVAVEARPFSEMEHPDHIQAVELSYSVAGRIGRLMEPIISPLGFDWRIGTALVGATAAKEVFVAQMGVVFAVGEADENSQDLRDQMQARYSPLVGLCIMIFTLISTPCVATFAVTRAESGSIRWALAQAVGLTLLAWLVTFMVYRGGLLLGMGG
ncbi:ferrous iron transport protein B [bacterium DOLZORAL124_64_63]|nr:MAG: ferrous iron transport protein B [bacterium DOLZORAL124_64_63]